MCVTVTVFTGMIDTVFSLIRRKGIAVKGPVGEINAVKPFWFGTVFGKLWTEPSAFDPFFE